MPDPTASEVHDFILECITVSSVWTRDELQHDRTVCSGTDSSKTQEVWHAVRTSAGRPQMLRLVNAGHEDPDTMQRMPTHSADKWKCFRIVCNAYRSWVEEAASCASMTKQTKQDENFLRWRIFVDKIGLHNSGRVGTQNGIVMLGLLCWIYFRTPVAHKWQCYVASVV
jgi:hypothetical protein